MRDKQTQRSRGFGFITFEMPNYETAKALTYRVITELEGKHEILGRKVDVKPGDGNRDHNRKRTQTSPGNYQNQEVTTSSRDKYKQSNSGQQKQQSHHHHHQNNAVAGPSSGAGD